MLLWVCLMSDVRFLSTGRAVRESDPWQSPLPGIVLQWLAVQASWGEKRHNKASDSNVLAGKGGGWSEMITQVKLRSRICKTRNNQFYRRNQGQSCPRDGPIRLESRADRSLHLRSLAKSNHYLGADPHARSLPCHFPPWLALLTLTTSPHNPPAAVLEQARWHPNILTSGSIVNSNVAQEQYGFLQESLGAKTWCVRISKSASFSSPESQICLHCILVFLNFILPSPQVLCFKPTTRYTVLTEPAPKDQVFVDRAIRLLFSH